MDNNRIVNYIEHSFLSSLLEDDEITDISFNGYSIYYMHNLQGRKLSDINISNNDAKDFIRQISNLAEKQFSFQNPILDVTAGKYRINAVHNSIARYKEEPVITFSIRLASSKPRIRDGDGYLTKELLSLVNVLIRSHVSIVIGGITGTGKTEFQKYLLGKVNNATRVIVIDNVLELSQKKEGDDVDITVWQADDRNLSTNLQLLVKNALRSNPDWLVIAESRGGEMLEILNSTMTGHPIITTIHAKSVDQMPNRIARMVMMNDKKSNYEDVLMDVYDSFPIHFYLKRKVDKHKRVIRYIDSICCINKQNKIINIYENKNGKHTYRHIPSNVLNLLEINDDELFISTFGGSGDESL